MTRLQILKTIVAIRLLARGEWTPAVWLLSISQKQRGRIRVLPEWLMEMCIASFQAPVVPYFPEGHFKIGDTLKIRTPQRFRGAA